MFDSSIKMTANKDYFIQAIFHFRKFEDYRQILRKQAMMIHRKAIVDPSFVAKITGKTGIGLGKIMEGIKNQSQFSYVNLFDLTVTEGRKLLTHYLESEHAQN